MSLVDKRSHPAGRTHSTPDDVIVHGLNYCLSLGLLRSFTVEREPFGRRRKGPRYWVLVFPEGNISRWTTATVSAYVAGVHDAMTRVEVR